LLFSIVIATFYVLRTIFYGFLMFQNFVPLQ